MFTILCFSNDFIATLNDVIANHCWMCLPTPPSMNPTEFIDNYLSELLQKFSKEDKKIMLMGDFNTDLLKYDRNTDHHASFFDALGNIGIYTNFLLPSQHHLNTSVWKGGKLTIFKRNPYIVNFKMT